MEWVETTGKTVEEALDLALDELGVDAADAEYEVLEEPKTGLFGRLRTEARLRARVMPTTPRAKEERRPRGRKSTTGAKDARVKEAAGKASDVDDATATSDAPPASPRRNERSRSGGRSPERPSTPRTTEKEPRMSDIEQDVPIAEQGECAAAFVQGVVERFGASSASVSTHVIDEDTVEVRVEGEDLGLLIGPKGAALQSLQELARTAVQRKTGARSGRVLVDVSGYRQRRKEALEKFARKIADDVLGGGTAVVLEPMTPADRKVIHDTVNDIDGVTTSSDGVEPRRRVVVSPA